MGEEKTQSSPLSGFNLSSPLTLHIIHFSIEAILMGLMVYYFNNKLKIQQEQISQMKNEMLKQQQIISNILTTLKSQHHPEHPKPHHHSKKHHHSKPRAKPPVVEPENEESRIEEIFDEDELDAELDNQDIEPISDVEDENEEIEIDI